MQVTYYPVLRGFTAQQWASLSDDDKDYFTRHRKLQDEQRRHDLWVNKVDPGSSIHEHESPSTHYRMLQNPMDSLPLHTFLDSFQALYQPRKQLPNDVIELMDRFQKVNATLMADNKKLREKVEELQRRINRYLKTSQEDWVKERLEDNKYTFR